MNVVFARKRGENYIGACPYPHDEGAPAGEQLAISPSRQFFHCFYCGIGGPLPDASDLEQTITDPPLDTIFFHVPSYDDAVAYMGKIRKNFLIGAKRFIDGALLPNILPFWEMGELVEVSLDGWRIQFPDKASVARAFISQHREEIEQLIQVFCGAAHKTKLVIS